MTGLGDLYQELILDHSKTPRNFRVLEQASRHVVGHNPLCGDRYIVYVKLDGDRIADVSFQGAGCAISKASASMMTASVKGKTRAEAEALFHKFHDMVRGEAAPDATDDAEELGSLAVFGGVAQFPMRVKCASLAWHTLAAALVGADEPVSTE